MLKTTLTLPFVLLGLPVGAWLDRVRRRPVMIRADVVRALALATVPAAHWTGHLTMAHLWAVPDGPPGRRRGTALVGGRVEGGRARVGAGTGTRG